MKYKVTRRYAVYIDEEFVVDTAKLAEEPHMQKLYKGEGYDSFDEMFETDPGAVLNELDPSAREEGDYIDGYEHTEVKKVPILEQLAEVVESTGD